MTKRDTLISASHPPTFNVIERTFLIRADGPNAIGTGFGVTWGSRPILFTARHIFEGCPISHFDVWRDDGWSRIGATPIQFPHEIDLLGFELAHPIWSDLEIDVGFEDVVFGDEAFVLGFPLALNSQTAKNLGIEFPIPFVAKGIVSAVASRLSINAKALFLSISLDAGFSGGPVISPRMRNRRHQVIGFVSHTLRFKDELSHEHGNQVIIRHPANLVVCTPMFEITKILGAFPEIHPK